MKLPSLALLLLVGPSLAQVSRNMVLEARIPFAPCTTGDVAAIGDFMLLARRSQGFAVIDARIPSKPVVKHVSPPGYPIRNLRSYGVGDIKADDRYIYATNEGTSTGGVFIYDAKDPMNPRFVSTAGARRGSVHNCWIDGKHQLLYTNRGDIYDVTNKAAPRLITRINIGFAHDVTVFDQRAYYSLWASGIAIYDVSSPAAPRLLGSKSYSGARCHSMWPSEDRKTLYTADETGGGHVRIWDISQLPAMTQVGSYRTGPTSGTVHNVYVSGDLLYVTYYKEGVRVCSIRDPRRPVEIAHYDTYLPTRNGCFGGIYAGCWGAYPWSLDKLFVSDLDSGGYILRLDVVPSTYTAKSTTVKPGNPLEMDFSYRNAGGTALNAFGIVWLTTINRAPAIFDFLSEAKLLAANQTVGHKLKIPIPIGLPNLTLGFTSYSGTFKPLTISQKRELTVHIRN